MLVDLIFINEPGTEFASPIHFKTSLTTGPIASGPPRAQTSMLFAGLSSFSQWFRVSDNTHHVGSRTAHTPFQLIDGVVDSRHALIRLELAMINDHQPCWRFPHPHGMDASETGNILGGPYERAGNRLPHPILCVAPFQMLHHRDVSGKLGGFNGLAC